MGVSYQRLDITKYFYSVALNATTTFSATEADYKGFNADPITLSIPVPDFVTSNEIGEGTGQENPDNQRLYKWQPVQIQLSGIVNAEICAILALRCNGGSITDTEVTTSASYTHANDFLAPTTSAPDRFHIILANDGVAFCFRVYVNNMTFTQSGNDQPRWQATLVADYWKEVGDVSGLDISTIAAAPTYHYMHGEATTLTYNDGSSIDITATGASRFLEVSAGIDNNCGFLDLPDGNFYTSGDYKSGAMPNTPFRGKPPQDSLFRMKVLPETDQLREWDKLISQTSITNVTVKFQGFEKVGVTSDRYFLQIKYPLAKYNGHQPSSQNSPVSDLNAYDIPLKVFYSSGVLVNVTSQDGNATLV